MRSVPTLALALTLLACGSGEPVSTSSSSTSTSVTTRSATSSASATSARSTPPPRPTANARSEPTKITGAIRDNSSIGDFKDGVAIELRLFVSKLTPNDPLHIAFRFQPDKPLDDEHPMRKEMLNASDVLSQLRFELVTPDGKQVLETSEKLGSEVNNLASFNQELTLDGAGATLFGKTAAWKKPVPDLLAKPGKYTIAIAGSIKTSSRTVSVSSKPLQLEVVEAGADFKSLADLAADAAELVRTKKSLRSAPKSHVPVIDDADGNRWHRFQLASDDGGRHGYDAEVVEVLVDPAGREVNYDAFVHFTCVAEGVPVLTPTGQVAVQELAPGDAVLAYDVELRKRTTAVVEHVRVGHAERLYAFGALRVTGAHPLFADGRFQPAADLAAGARLLGSDLVTFAAAPLELDVPATVYELTVSAPHTYFAGGALVHNKAAHEPVGGQKQAWNGWFYRRAVKR